MRKFVANPVAGGTPITLGDDTAGDKISAGLPVSDSMVQVFRPFRGPYTVRYCRGNVTNSLTWSVDRDHGNEKTAMDFLRDHAQAVVNLGICNVQDFGQGITSRWWTNADIKVRAKFQVGQNTVFEYQMNTGAILPTLSAM